MTKEKSNVAIATVKTTVRELYKVLNVCDTIEAEVTNKDNVKLRTKEGIALRGFIMHTVQPALEEYQQTVQSINAKNCKLDKDGCIVYDEKDRLKFTPDGDLERRKEIEKAKDKVVELKKHAVLEIPKLPDSLNTYDVELLEKFLIFN
jgi:hypothetical protein